MNISNRLTKIYILSQLMDEITDELNHKIEKDMKNGYKVKPNFLEIKSKLKSLLRSLKPFDSLSLYDENEDGIQTLTDMYEFIINFLSSKDMMQDVKLANVLSEMKKM